MSLINYETGRQLLNPDQNTVSEHIEQIVSSGLAGFTITQARKSYKLACKAAKGLGFQGDTKAAVPFEHDARVSEALALINSGQSLEGTWRDYGVTQLHADGDAEDDMLSAVHVRKGKLELRIFERGPAIKKIDAIDLFDELESETQQVLATGKTSDGVLMPDATILSASQGDTLIFNPSQVHMAVTLAGPRYSDSTFFQR